MGEAWLPERLIGTQLEGDMLFLHFDNAPEDGQGDEEALHRAVLALQNRRM